MSWLRVRAPHFSRGVRIVDLSKVAALSIIENDEKTVIELRSANDSALAQVIAKKDEAERVIDALTLLIEQSKQFSDARVLTIDEVLNDSTPEQQGVWA